MVFGKKQGRNFTDEISALLFYIMVLITVSADAVPGCLSVGGLCACILSAGACR